MVRTYSELCKLKTLKDRFEYLKLSGEVGRATFGGSRYLNQIFYTSDEWKTVRAYCIVRDNGCDLGVEGYEIRSGLTVHHMNPITIEQIENHDPRIVDPEYLICASYNTHKAIHYSNEQMLPKDYVPRTPGDTCLW